MYAVDCGVLWNMGYFKSTEGINKKTWFYLITIMKTYYATIYNPVIRGDKQLDSRFLKHPGKV